MLGRHWDQKCQHIPDDVAIVCIPRLTGWSLPQLGSAACCSVAGGVGGGRGDRKATAEGEVERPPLQTVLLATKY